MRTIADEARSPKYSHVERERRWLVDTASLPPLPDRHVLIEDRYLRGARFRLRRMTDSATGETALKFAKKYDTSADPTARPMVNAYLDVAEYELFAQLPADAVRKRRYAIDGFSLDVFEGVLAGLVLVEREAEDAATLIALEAPDWATCEVTDHPRFQGASLATMCAEGLCALLAETRVR